MSNAGSKTIESFTRAFRLHSLKKNEELKCYIEGQNSICFNLDGLLYEWQKEESTLKGGTTPLKFYQPGQLFTLSPKNHPQTTILAIQQSHVLISDLNKIKAILTRDPAVLDLINDIYQQCQRQNHQRIANLTASPAKVRYEMASQQLGALLYHIPKNLLANYLNISRKQLQRIIYQQLLIDKK
nr:Crp/Fnr family transcriptional regulator [Pedobacter ureilyticus]